MNCDCLFRNVSAIQNVESKPLGSSAQRQSRLWPWAGHHFCTVWLRLPSRNAWSLDTILHESLSLFVIPCNPRAPLSDLLFPQKFRKYVLNKQTNPLTKIDVFRAASPKFSFKPVFNKTLAKILICNSSQLFYWNQFKAKHFLNAYEATKIINNVWLSFKPWKIQSPNPKRTWRQGNRKPTWNCL